MRLWAKKSEKKVARRPTKKLDATASNTPKIRYVLVGLGLAAVIAGAVWWVMTLPLLELKDVEVKSKSRELKHVTQAELSSVVKRTVKGNLLTANLESIQHAFEQLPWVRSVSLRRQWPGSLEAELEEHMAFARWKSGGMVNNFGEHFNAVQQDGLPLLGGPEGSETEVAQQYRAFGDMLQSTPRKPVEVSLSARRAWQIKLDDGAVIELGRSDVEKRLARFVSVYGKTAGQPSVRAKYVDLRYSNGIAMKLIAAVDTKLDAKPDVKQP
jgi:cell division protein FtsQ